MKPVTNVCFDILNNDGTWNYDFDYTKGKPHRISMATVGTNIILARLQDGHF